MGQRYRFICNGNGWGELNDVLDEISSKFSTTRGRKIYKIPSQGSGYLEISLVDQRINDGLGLSGVILMDIKGDSSKKPPPLKEMIRDYRGELIESKPNPGNTFANKYIYFFGMSKTTEKA